MAKRTPFLVMFLLLAVHSTEHMYGGVMPVLFPFIMKEFSLTYTQLGVLAASYMFTSSFLQLFAGLLAKWILRRILIGAGVVWAGAMTFAAGLARGFWDLVHLRMLAGVGASAYHPTSGSLISDLFARSSRGRIMGLHLAAGNLGSAIVPILASVLAVALGWRTTLHAFAAPGFVAGAAFLLLVKEGARPEGKMQSIRSSLGKIARSRETSALTVASTLLSFRSSAIATFLPTCLTNMLGFQAPVVGMLLSVMYAASIPGPLVLGYVSDRVGRKKVILILCILSTLAIWLFAIDPLSGLLPLNLLTLGVAAYSAPAVIQAFLGDITDPSLRDAAFAAYFTVTMTLGYSLAPATVGMIIDKFGFSNTFAFLGIVSASAALFVLPVEERT